MNRKIRRIALVNPFSSFNVEKQKYAANDTCFPPLGLLYLKQWVKNFFSEIKVEVFDGDIIAGNILSAKKKLYQSLKDFSPDIVGISVLTPTYKAGLEISEFVKNEFGSIVVLGNDHACFFPELILNKRESIDYIVHSDVGEIPFIELLDAIINRKKLCNISSIAYRNGKKVIVNPNRKYKLNNLYKADTNIFPLPPINFEIYADNYNKKYKKIHNKKIIPITINGVRGCSFSKKKCYYCSIYDLTTNKVNIQYYWNTIKYLNEHYNVNYFFEVCDNFTGFYEHLNNLVETKPSNLNDIMFSIYGRASDIVKKRNRLIPLLKKLGVQKINMGLDSGDPVSMERLKFTNNGEKEIEFNLNAVQYISENEIYIHASFIAGALGETSKQLKNTSDFIKDMLGVGKFSAIEYSKLVPLPNSIYWDMFIGKMKISEMFPGIDIDVSAKILKEMREKYSNNDLMDINSVANDWRKYFTNLSEDEVDKEIDDINKELKQKDIESGVNII